MQTETGGFHISSYKPLLYFLFFLCYKDVIQFNTLFLLLLLLLLAPKVKKDSIKYNVVLYF